MSIFIGGRCRSFDVIWSQPALPREMSSDLCCGLLSNKRPQFLISCSCNALYGTKASQQLHLALLTYSRDLREFGAEVAFLTALAVKLDRRLVRFLAYLQDETEGE